MRIALGIGNLVLVLYILLGQAFALPGGVVLRVLDKYSTRIASGSVSYKDMVVYEDIRGSRIQTRQLRPADQGALSGGTIPSSTDPPLSDFVYFPGNTDQGILAFTSQISRFSRGDGQIGFALLDFTNAEICKGIFIDGYLGANSGCDKANGYFGSLSLSGVAPYAEPSALAVSIPSGGSTFPRYAALTYYNQTIVFGVDMALMGRGKVTVVSRIPGQNTGIAFLDNERLALVGSKGISLVAASTGTILASTDLPGLSAAAAYNGVTVFWGKSQLAVLEGNSLKASTISDQTIDSCSIVMTNIPVCLTSGKGKTLWYYAGGQWFGFWNNPDLTGDDPWAIGVGEGFILPFISNKTTNTRVTLYAGDGVEIGSSNTGENGETNYKGTGLHLVSIVGLAAKLKNETAPGTDFVSISPKRCNRPYGRISQVANWVLVTGCQEVTLIDFQEGRVIFQGSEQEVLSNIIFQISGNRVSVGNTPGQVRRDLDNNASHFGLGKSVDNKPLLFVRNTPIPIRGFDSCAVATALTGNKFSAIVSIPLNKPGGNNASCSDVLPNLGTLQGYVSDTEIALFTYNSNGSAFTVFDRSGKQLVSFPYKGNALTTNGKLRNMQTIAFTEVLPTANGYRLFGYLDGTIGSFELNLLDGSLSTYVRAAPISGSIWVLNYNSYVLPTAYRAIGDRWRFYQVPTVEGLAIPSYVSPEGHLIYVTDKGIVRIKLSNESIKRWAGQ